MTGLGVPIYLEAHTGPGIVDATAYQDTIAAVHNARVVAPNLRIFASPKSDSGPLPGWIFDSSGAIVPSGYGRLLADYLELMASHGVRFDVNGLDNEGAVDGFTPAEN